MRLMLALGLLGAVLGGAVAVLAHFLSETVPSTFEVVGAGYEGGRGEQTVVTPLVHPSWWPTLPVAIAVGAVVGTAAGAAIRWWRRTSATATETTDTGTTDTGTTDTETTDTGTTDTGTAPAGDIDIALTSDEALVLFDLLHRWEDADAVTEPHHPAEQTALWAVSSLLERELVEPFDPGYRDLVAAARARLVSE